LNGLMHRPYPDPRGAVGVLVPVARRADDRVACGDAVIAAAYRGSYYVGIRPFGRRRAPAPKAKRSRQASTSAATTRSGEVPGSAILVMKYMLQSCTLKRTFY
jgi:1-acyl-sn-glycerol-3-phosphate acyltransferase